MPYYVMQFIQGLSIDEVLEELKRMQTGKTPMAAPNTGGEMRLTRTRDGAAEVARSLMTGEFQLGAALGMEDAEEEVSAALAEPSNQADASRSPAGTEP